MHALPSAAAAPRRQVFIGTALAGAAAAAALGGMLALWWRFRSEALASVGSWVPADVSIPMVPANVMLIACLPICIFAVGHGVHQPCGQAGAVSAFPHAAGLASALAGFALALVAFGVGLWLGQALDGSVRPLALGVSVGSCLSALAAWTVVRRHGEPPAPAAVPRTVEATA